MKIKILLYLILILSACNKKTEKQEKTYIKIYDIVYKDNNGEYYFKYNIPKRIKKDDLDIGKNTIVYDSIISFNDSIVTIKNIIDIESIYKTSEGYLSDENYIYIQRETNITPKFYAIKIENYK